MVSFWGFWDSFILTLSTHEFLGDSIICLEELWSCVCLYIEDTLKIVILYIKYLIYPESMVCCVVLVSTLSVATDDSLTMLSQTVRDERLNRLMGSSRWRYISTIDHEDQSWAWTWMSVQ